MTYQCRFSNGTLAVAALALAGCGGLPQYLLDQAQAVSESIRAESDRTDRLEAEFLSFRQTDEFGVVAPYADREDWSAYFTEARAKVGVAETVYNDEVAPLVKQDDLDGAKAIQRALGKIAPLLAAAREAAARWQVRRDLLVRVANDTEQYREECAANWSSFEEAYAKLRDRSNRATGDHAARSDDIARLLEPLENLHAATEPSAGAATAAFRSSGTMDLAVVADSCEAVRGNWEQFQKADPEVQARLAELDRSYSRTLMDMNVEYGLVVRRQSWDNAYDYPEIHTTDYRVENIDAGAYEQLASVSGSLATVEGGWWGSRLRLDRSLTRASWTALGINESQLPGRDDAAEFWVESDASRYLHKYLVQENGETTETDWTEVTKEFYAQNVENLGMDVESKPYGSFESEKLTHAAPPGMAYVGNPHYGRWASDGSGGSFWSWYGPYLFYRTMFGSPMGYSRSDWNTWNGGYRGTRPFYGGTSSAPRWGSRSRTVTTSPKMAGSTFARSGGLRRPSPSVRGAGPSSRGGSFGASGK